MDNTSNNIISNYNTNNITANKEENNKIKNKRNENSSERCFSFFDPILLLLLSK